MRPARTPGLVLAALAVVVLSALAVRIATLPGHWGADDFFNVELATGRAPLAGHGDRDFRLLFLSMLRAGLWISADRPWGAVLPVMLVSLATIPLTWLAARRVVGDGVALLPAAIVAALPVFFEETTQPSNDGPLAAFGAALVWLLPAVLDADERTRGRAILAVGTCLGLATVFKEIFLLTAIPAAAWLAWQAIRRRLRWRDFVVVGCVAAAFVVVDQLTTRVVFGGAGRIGGVSGTMAAVRSADTFGEGIQERVRFGPLLGMATDRVHWGAFWVVGAGALLVSAMGRRRGHPAVWIALASPLVLWFLPISLTTWALLPVWPARYLLGAVPAAAVAMFLPFAEDESPAALPRHVVVGVLGLALVMVSAPSSSATAAAIAVGFVVLVLPRRLIAPAHAACCSGAAVFATLPWAGSLPWWAAWALVLPVIAALVARSRPWAVPAATALALIAYTVADFEASAWKRVRDRTVWTLWDIAGDAPRIFATPTAFRAMRIAADDAVSPRLRLWAEDDRSKGEAPADAGAGDLLVAEGGLPRHGIAVVDRVAARSPDLAAVVDERPGVTLIRLERRK